MAKINHVAVGSGMPNPCTILVIDDEPNLYRSMELILQSSGYFVESAKSGSEALALLNERGFDLIFLDLRLPDMNGIDLLPSIRKINPDTPVLILTAHASLDSAINAVKSGARDYLLKPLDPPVILQRVKEILTEQEQPRRRREIASEIQNLLSELNQIEGENSTPGASMPVTPPLDPDRFLVCGGITLDLHTRHVLLNEKYVPLPPTTFDYLVTLARHSPQPVSFEALVSESQGYKMTRSEAREMVRWQIHELRKALEIDPSEPNFILTVRNVGYRLVM
jgi:DNA-binding response OmpR family regulator